MRTSLLPLAVLALGAAVFARPGDPVATNPAEAPALLAALDSIRADHISADLHFFASDAMKGRDTPSPEQRIAARFLAARLERLGWTPGAQDGSWFWEFELPTVSMDFAGSKLSAAKGGAELSLKLGEDYSFYPGRLTTHDVSADGIVFGGTLREEEVDKLVFEGRWLLVRSAEDRDYREISKVARKGDAAGVLIAPGPGTSAAEMAERIREQAAQMAEPVLSRGGSRESRGIPFVYVSESAAQRLFELGGLADPQVGAVAEVALREARLLDDQSTAGLENVVGLWPGSDPALKDEVILLSAHYDHVGVSDDGEVYNGADDNGSGSMCLLNVAEALTRYGPMRRSVMILWVSGEEKGLLGSAAWTKDPYLPEGMKPVLDINIDMVGRNAPDSLLVTPTRDHEAYNGLTRLAEAHCAEEGFPELGSADAYWSRSDHANFSRNLGLPVVFLFSDVHEDYHKVTDTPDKIDYDKIRRVARLVVRMLDGLQGDVLELD